MKIERLLSIIIFLLNRDLVTARELAGRFEVSVRTIQRDMEALCRAGIPILSAKGPHGGFGIIESYKLDRQLVDTNDLFFILTSLESISTAFQNPQIGMTLEKVKSIISNYQQSEIDKLKDKFHIDFTALSVPRENRNTYALVEEAIEKNRLIRFNYCSMKNELTDRTIEPMTIVFKWYSWYLFGYCLLRNGFRFFRISRMKDAKLLTRGFERRPGRYEDFEKDFNSSITLIPVRLRFDIKLRHHLEDYFGSRSIEEITEDAVIIRTQMPEDNWLYGMILSYGECVEVLEPEHIRDIIRDQSQKIFNLYQKN